MPVAAVPGEVEAACPCGTACRARAASEGAPVKAHLHYASYVIRHKWFVFRAGLRTGAPLWRLLIHDWSKLTPAEWFPYVRKFYGPTPDWQWLRNRYSGRPNDDANLADWKAEQQAAFDAAWLHHQHRSPHHWQHWLLRLDDGPTEVLRMPVPLVREMVADWMGAGRAITGRWDVAGWYAANHDKLVLHPDVRVQVENLIANHGSPAANRERAPARAPSPTGGTR